MDNSIFLAKFWGWYLIIFFLILSFNPKRIKQIFTDLNDEKFLILTAFIAIIVGLVNILFHNVWELNWKIIVTLIGWVSLFIGLALFIFPNRTIPSLELMNIKFVQVIYMLLFFIGLFLLNIVYEIVPV
jgi:membrane associated rhomboid family serine protease